MGNYAHGISIDLGSNSFYDYLFYPDYFFEQEYLLNQQTFE